MGDSRAWPRGRRQSRVGSGVCRPGCIGGFVGTPADMVNVRSVPSPRSGSFLAPDRARASPERAPPGLASRALGGPHCWGGEPGGRVWARCPPEPAWLFQDAERHEAAPGPAPKVSSGPSSAPGRGRRVRGPRPGWLPGGLQKHTPCASVPGSPGESGVGGWVTGIEHRSLSLCPRLAPVLWGTVQQAEWAWAFQRLWEL